MVIRGLADLALAAYAALRYSYVSVAASSHDPKGHLVDAINTVGHALGWCVWIATFAGLFALLPALLFQRTRTGAMVGLYGVSWVYGLFLWWAALALTFEYGGWSLLIPSLFFGVGPIPVGMIAAAAHSDWPALEVTGGFIAAICVVRGFCWWMAVRMEH